MEPIVFDSYAIIAFVHKEDCWSRVGKYLNNANTTKVEIYMSYINIAEFYYKIYRELGKKDAHKGLSNLQALPITLVSATNERVLKAVEIKGEYPIALGGCFAVATALEFGATVLSGDPELERIEDIVKINWLK